MTGKNLRECAVRMGRVLVGKTLVEQEEVIANTREVAALLETIVTQPEPTPTTLRQVYGKVLKEPIPEPMLALLRELGVVADGKLQQRTQ